MARPYPTEAEVLELRPDITEYMSDKDDIDSITEKALKQVKIDLEDKRGVLWNRVYDSDSAAYFTGSDGYTRNDDKIPRMIALQSIYMVFRDYAINAGADSQWWTDATAYRDMYDDLLHTAKLDIDANDSGTITDDEDATTGQRFLRR